MKLTLALLLLPLLGPRPVADRKTEFGTALDQVQRFVDTRRWKEARASLVTALDAHADQTYVREKLERVRTLLAKCEFELACPDRGVKSVFCGEVASYDAKSGEIELRWSKPKADEPAQGKFPCEDFEITEWGRVLRVPFDGPHSIEFTGPAIGEVAPLVRVCMEESRFYEAELASGPWNKVTRVENEEAKMLLPSSITAFNREKPYVLTLNVRATQIEVRHNDMRLVLVDKVKGEFGRLGFKRVSDPQKIVVRGKARKAWLDEQIFERRQQERAEFDKTFDVNAALPAWLRK